MQAETIRIEETVESVLARNPSLSRVFEQSGIDYCCGGRVSLETACRERGIDPSALLKQLEEADTAQSSIAIPSEMSLSELARHIEGTHHAYLNTELPRIMALAEKVAMVHGGKDSRLLEILDIFIALVQEMRHHMMKEETILFPMIRSLDAAETTPKFHCGSLANPIRQMQVEHREAKAALARLRHLTDGYSIPAGACGTYRAMLEALSKMDQDLEEHIAKEDEILFPRVLKAERR